MASILYTIQPPWRADWPRLPSCAEDGGGPLRVHGYIDSGIRSPGLLLLGIDDSSMPPVGWQELSLNLSQEASRYVYKSMALALVFKPAELLPMIFSNDYQPVRDAARY